MPIIYEDDQVQIVETVTPNGRTLQFINKPGSVGDNLDLLKSRAEKALTTNATYLAQPAYPASPTTAQRDAAIRAIRAQVDALTRQANGLIRLELSQLDSISDA